MFMALDLPSQSCQFHKLFPFGPRVPALSNQEPPRTGAERGRKKEKMQFSFISARPACGGPDLFERKRNLFPSLLIHQIHVSLCIHLHGSTYLISCVLCSMYNPSAFQTITSSSCAPLFFFLFLFFSG